jgi:4-amino-4-deoxy-L-arabinose transferase-like glycosyltransferase
MGWICWFLFVVVFFALRILAPSDLGQNLDQSKTIAFTIDMVNNNQWVLPKDGLEELTRKPPLVNWVGAPIVAMGFHSELALKLPALFSGFAILTLVYVGARFLFSQLAAHESCEQESSGHDTSEHDTADRAIARYAHPLALLASAAWLASPSALKHIYFMRPDILFTALLIASWLCATKLLSPQSPSKYPRLLAFGIWLFTALAILTKGPLALIVPLYIIAHIILITPRDERKPAISSTGWYWGVPLMLIIPLLWLYSAYRVNPEHVTGALLGTELGSRVGRGGSSAILVSLYKIPGFFFERFIPWSIPALLAILFPPLLFVSARGRSHPLAPAVLWVLVIFVVTVLGALTSGSYIMPALPVTAILAVYALFRIIAGARVLRIKPVFIVIPMLIVASASLVTIRETTMSRGAKTNTGEHLKLFASQADQIIGTEHVKFVEIGDLPIASLMGRHQSDQILQDQPKLQSARWLIQPTSHERNRVPEITSQPILTHDSIVADPSGQAITISLYRLD